MMNFKETSVGNGTNHSEDSNSSKIIGTNVHLAAAKGTDFDDMIEHDFDDITPGELGETLERIEAQVEESDSQSQECNVDSAKVRNELPPKKDIDNIKPKTVMDKVAINVAEKLQTGVRTSDKEAVKNAVIDLFATTMAINSVPRFSTGLVVDDELWRWDEYRISEPFSKLIVADAFLINDDNYAIDLKDRAGYKMTIGKKLSPSKAILASKTINKLCRVNLQIAQVNRLDVSLLTDNYVNQATKQKVVSRGQSRLDFIKINLGDNAVIEWKEWVAYFASQILDMR